MKRNSSNRSSWRISVTLWLFLLTGRWSATAFVVVPLIGKQQQHRNHAPLDTTTYRSSLSMALYLAKHPYSHPKDAKHHHHQPHVFKHLFRHYEDISFDSWIRCAEPASFLRSVGLSNDEIQELEKVYPNLPEFVVHDQIAPKVRFLVETLHAGSGKLTWKTATPELPAEQDEECEMHADMEEEQAHYMRLSDIGKKLLVPFLSTKYALDRTEGPRHAFLARQGLPHGPALLEHNGKLFLEFLQAFKISDFVKLCNQWAGVNTDYYTESMVQDFCYEFGAGLAAAAKKHGDTTMIPLLIQHGANHKETDSHGVSPLHYAAGMGNLPGVQALLSVMGEDGDSTIDKIFWDNSAKDGATAFHWACCGIDEHKIGIGGSMEVCQWMLDQANSSGQQLELVNSLTWSKATPLMWAAWSGSRDICEYLLQHGADYKLRDSHDATVGHWAAAGGDFETCQYLLQAGAMDLMEADDTGTTPMQYVIQQHTSTSELVQWMTTLQNLCSTKSE